MARTFLGLGTVVAVLGLSGCGVTSQLHSELAFDGVAVDPIALDTQGVGVLTPSAPTGKESDKQALGNALGTALEAAFPAGKVVPMADMLSAINRSGLARPYGAMLDEYGDTGILEREALRQIGEAAGVRYLAKFNLGGFDQSSDKRLAIAGIRMFDTWRAQIRVHLELWDSHTGEIAWEGNEELTFAREGVKERPVSFVQVAQLAAEQLVARVGDSGSATVDETPESFAAVTPEDLD